MDDAIPPLRHPVDELPTTTSQPYLPPASPPKQLIRNLIMFLVALAAGFIISASLAYSGLVRQSLQASGSKTITGLPAQIIGGVCLLFSLACLIPVILIVVNLLNQSR